MTAGAVELAAAPARWTSFGIARLAVRIAAGLTIASVLAYPGGTFHDRGIVGYRFASNFLSDLGMTVAHGGQSNRFGALLFVVALCTVVAGLGGALAGFVRLYADRAASRAAARLAAAVGAVAGASFVGVALTPENSLLSLHVAFTMLGFHVLPLVVLLLALASFHSDALPQRVTAAWFGLTALLVLYVLVLRRGPALHTPGGLVAHVLAQKAVVVAVVGTLYRLCGEAERTVVASGGRGDWSGAGAPV